jgi:hypothetical protein
MCTIMNWLIDWLIEWLEAQYLDMNCYVWDLKLSWIVMQVFRRREELSGYLDKWDFTEILIKIKNINHHYMIFVMYMNVLNN